MGLGPGYLHRVLGGVVTAGPLAVRDGVTNETRRGRAQTMSFRPLSARILTFVVAGFAATSINSPGLNGFGTPLRALRAGTCFLSILTRPGSVNAPAPRRPMLLEIWALRESRTALTVRRLRSVSLPIAFKSSVLVMGFFAAVASFFGIVL